MNFTRYTLVAMFLALPLNSPAQTSKACLNILPESIKATLQQDNWKILEPQDLAAEDLPVFKGNHPGECPGITHGSFYPKADSSFVVALIQLDDQKHVLEKTVLVTQKKNKTETAVIIPPTSMPAIAVVWRVPPGHWRGIDGTKVGLSHDSFISEQIISTATQYYYNGKHLKSFPISR